MKVIQMINVCFKLPLVQNFYDPRVEVLEYVDHYQRIHLDFLISCAVDMTACNCRNSVLTFFTNCALRILDSEAANSASRLPCHQKSLIHHSSVESESLHHFRILRGNISIPLIRQIESQVSPAITPDTPRQSTR